MPASRMAWMSCQRLVFGPDPGTVVCAISSTNATAGCRCNDGVEVHLLEDGAAVAHLSAREDRQITDPFGRVQAAMGLDESDHHVGATLQASVALVEHGVRLTDPWGRPEIDAQHAASPHAHLRSGSSRPRVQQTAWPAPAVQRRREDS